MKTQTRAITFKASAKDHDLVHKIVKRVFDERLAVGRDTLDWEMDLLAVHSNGCPMDFKKLLQAERFDFVHDVAGIYRHLNRTTGQLEGCFLPRCAVHGK